MGAGASSPTSLPFSRPPELLAAEVRRVNAEAAAITRRAASEEQSAANDEKRASADLLLRQQSAANDLLLRFLPVAVCGALAAGLALDFYLHESPAHIRRRMLRFLRASRPPTLPLAPTALLPVPQRPVTPGFIPSLIIGPSGCGKSTLLGSIVAGLPTATPIVVVRMRLPSLQPSGAAGDAAAPEREAPALMDETARQIFSQVGFPLRRSLIGSALSRGFRLQGGPVQAELSVVDTSSRLVLALRILFDVSEELQRERQRTMDPLDAAPVLLFDEVQDLVKDARLARAGGRLILSVLGTLLVSYGVDRRAVRAMVTGSSAEVAFAFEECSPLRGARWECHSLLDPEEGATRAALEARGYSAEEAQGMMDLCGTRMRLLERPLLRGAAGCSYADFVRGAEVTGGSAFASVFDRLDRDDAALLGRLLDSIEACEAAAEGAGGRSSDAARPTKKMLTGGLQHLDMAPIFYIDRYRKLYFQSLLHRRTWARLRSEYVAPSPAGQ